MTWPDSDMATASVNICLRGLSGPRLDLRRQRRSFLRRRIGICSEVQSPRQAAQREVDVRHGHHKGATVIDDCPRRPDPMRLDDVRLRRSENLQRPVAALKRKAQGRVVIRVRYGCSSTGACRAARKNACASSREIAVVRFLGGEMKLTPSGLVG